MKITAFWFFIGATLIFCVNCITQIPTDGGVLVLTKDNFEEAISQNEHILVAFYAPWCGHSKALAPEYVKAAKFFAENDPTIKLAKVDATVESELAEMYKVYEYPTLTFFRGGQAFKYGGGRRVTEIVAWLFKASYPPAQRLNSVEEAIEFVLGHNVSLIGFFRNPYSDRATSYIIAANVTDTPAFGMTSCPKVMSKLNAIDGDIVLFKSHGSNPIKFVDEMNTENLKKFIQLQTLPLLIEFTHEMAAPIFRGPMHMYLIFFVSKSAGHIEKFIEPLEELAKKYRNDILFVAISSDEEDHRGIYNFFGMSMKPAPRVCLVNMEKKMIKYVPELEDMSVEYLDQFLKDFFDGKLKQFQDMPQIWNDALIDLVVAASDHDDSFDSKLMAIVDLYMEFCRPCTDLAFVYYHLGEQFDAVQHVGKALKEIAIELEHSRILLNSMELDINGNFEMPKSSPMVETLKRKLKELKALNKYKGKTIIRDEL